MNKLPASIDSKYIVEKLNEFLSMSFFKLATIANDHNNDTFSVLLAQALLKSHGRGEMMTLGSALKMLTENSNALAIEHVSTNKRPKKTFLQFCEDSGYQPPYAKQIEIKDFIIHGEGVRMLLGSRGYGKTDYGEILGYCYLLYCEYMDGNVTSSCILITKSSDKNTQIMNECKRILEDNGVELTTANASSIRVAGLIGKDDSLVAIPMGSASFRGRHPKRIMFDDPVTPEDTSEVVRARAKLIYNEAFKLCDNIVIVGQPAHRFDLYEELRKTINCMEVPHGTIPELDHDLDVQRLGGVDEDSIQASYFLKTSTENASPFSTINSIDTFPVNGAVAWIDPSFTGGDYTALSIFSSYFSGVAVVGYVRKKAWNHCIEELLLLCKKHNVKKLCIECNSLGDSPVNLIRAKVKEMGLSIGVSGKASTTEKHADIVNAGTYAESLYLSQISDKLYIDHVTKYEYKSKFDDAPDSLARGLMWIGIVKPKNANRKK